MIVDPNVVEPNNITFYFLEVFAASFDCELEWIIIKGVSHFADGNERGRKIMEIVCQSNDGFGCSEYLEKNRYS